LDCGVMDPVTLVDTLGYAVSVSFYGGAEPKQTYLFIFDLNGDTLWTNQFREDSDNGTRQLIRLADGRYLHCGWCSVPEVGACITLLDVGGSVLWNKIYSYAEYNTQYIF